MLRKLDSFDEVVMELGGVANVARLTDRSMPSVSNWRKKGGTFPTRLYFTMINALMDRGCYAPRALWGFEQQSCDAA